MAGKPNKQNQTKQLLLDTLGTLLETNTPDSITSEQVLTVSRVSSGSLYHHFESFTDLMDQALVAKFSRFADRTIQMLDDAFEAADTLEEFRQGTVEARRLTHGPTYAQVRALRVWIVAQATVRPSLRAAVGREQDRLTREMTKLVKNLQAKGWARTDIDPMVVALFIQAYQFGSVLDDVATVPVNNLHWVDFLDSVISRSVFGLPT